MKKLIAAVLSAVCAITALWAIPFQAGTYNRIDTVQDWGAVTSKIILNMGSSLTKGTVDNNTFTVDVTRTDPRVSENPVLESGRRTVVAAYVSSEDGTPVDKGRYVTLELEIAPNLSIGSVLNYYDSGNAWIDCEYTITQQKDIIAGQNTITGFTTTKLANIIRPQLDVFTYGAEICGEYTLGYASFKPENASIKNKKPLLIWLHGGGEGGTDASIPLSANKACDLAGTKIQNYFGGAYVLVPQAPTKWMDDGTGERRPATSIYTEALKYLIDAYIAQNDGIDTGRIYIGGCSNGGFMTLRILLDYPDFFAAAYPICEGMKNSHLTDEDIQILKDQKMWFVLSARDTTLPGPEFTLPTYDRLIKADAQDVFLTYFRDVTDKSGLYKTEDGSPYEYDGHWIWIHVYNNDVCGTINGSEITLMEWLAQQAK